MKGFKFAFGSGNVEFDLTVSINPDAGLAQDAFRSLASIASDIVLRGAQGAAASIPALARNIVVDAVRQLSLGTYVISIRLTEPNRDTFSETLYVEPSKILRVVSASRSKFETIELQVLYRRKLEVEFVVSEASHWPSEIELDTPIILQRFVRLINSFYSQRLYSESPPKVLFPPSMRWLQNLLQKR